MNDTIQLQPELFCMLDATPIKTQEDGRSTVRKFFAFSLKRNTA